MSLPEKPNTDKGFVEIWDKNTIKNKVNVL